MNRSYLLSKHYIQQSSCYYQQYQNQKVQNNTTEQTHTSQQKQLQTIMSFQTQFSSNTFNIQHTSREIDINKHFHTKEMEIIKQGQPRKVVFGQMEQQERSIYEIVSPYMTTVAKTTGNIALQAGTIAYEYLKQGFWWFYDQITNKVIPYTKEQIPKLIFIISKSAGGQKAIKSGQFCVLQMQDQDYKQIAKKQRQNQGPIKVLIPLGQKDQALIEEIKRNHEVSYSFPIDDLDGDSERMSVTYCIPSESYEIIEGEAKAALKMERSKAIDITQHIQEQILQRHEVQKVQENLRQVGLNEQLENDQKSNKLQQLQQKPQHILHDYLNNQTKKAHEQQQWQEVRQSYIRQKAKPKAIFLPDACCFIYEQQDQLYPFLRQRLELDSNAIAGHLVSSEQFKKRESKDSSSGEVPLITVDQKIGNNIQVRKQIEVCEVKEERTKKIVDMERRVRPEIGGHEVNENKYLKKEQLLFN